MFRLSDRDRQVDVSDRHTDTQTGIPRCMVKEPHCWLLARKLVFSTWR